MNATSQPSGTGKATAQVGSNIAFIKYWGVANAQLNLPLNNSISMTLENASTTTTVAFGNQSDKDLVVLDGEELSQTKVERIVHQLDRLRALAGVDLKARVESQNNFPMASGIASSASGFAALTVASAAALGLDLSPGQLSGLARRASGSASRSLFGGFVEWEKGDDDLSSRAHQLYPAEHWDLHDVVAVVSSEEKAVSSASGHLLAESSPLLPGRIAHLPQALDEVRTAISTRDLDQLGPAIELDALSMCSVMMTSTPTLLYWRPGTIEIFHMVQKWRNEDGLSVYYTVDAGPNVHLICEAEIAPEVESRLQRLSMVERIISGGPGPGPRLLTEHLF